MDRFWAALLSCLLIGVLICNYFSKFSFERVRLVAGMRARPVPSGGRPPPPAPAGRTPSRTSSPAARTSTARPARGAGECAHTAPTTHRATDTELYTFVGSVIPARFGTASSVPRDIPLNPYNSADVTEAHGRPSPTHVHIKTPIYSAACDAASGHVVAHIWNLL